MKELKLKYQDDPIISELLSLVEKQREALKPFAEGWITGRTEMVIAEETIAHTDKVLKELGT